MAKVSNVVITTLNLITSILALAAIGTYIYLHYINSSPTHCQRAVERPILAVGLALLAVSLLGLIGSGCRISSLLWTYLVVLVLIILGWFVFSIFVFFVTNKGAGKAVSGVGVKEYRLGDYSHWLQKHVVNGKNWGQIRSCLVETKVCENAGLVISKNGADFLKDNLTPLQSGCCKPPASCGFTRKNGTYWEAPPSKNGTASSDDPDCKAWSNDTKTLCYDCKSCKAGALANLRKEWRSFSILNAAIIVILFVIYMVGCCAVHNNRHHHSPKYRPGYP